MDRESILGLSVYEAGLFSTRLRHHELLPDPLSHGKVPIPVKVEKTFNDTPVCVGKALNMILNHRCFGKPPTLFLIGESV
jgi:hypothetical protein